MWFTPTSIGTCRPGHCPGYFESFALISRGPDVKKCAPMPPYFLYSICVLMRLRTHRRTYSVQCSDYIRFPQQRINCGVAKSCPGTPTALQAPMPRPHLKNYKMGQAHSQNFPHIRMLCQQSLFGIDEPCLITKFLTMWKWEWDYQTFCRPEKLRALTLDRLLLSPPRTSP